MIIHNKPNGANIVWDKTKDKPLLNFKGGSSFETTNNYIANKAKELGYEVEGIAAAETEKPKRSTKKSEKVGE